MNFPQHQSQQRAAESQHFVAGTVSPSRPRAWVENGLENVQSHRARSFSIPFPFHAPDRSERRSLPCRTPQHSGILALLLLLLFPITTLASELPRKAPPGKYNGLWNNSPFTSRPVVVAPPSAPEVNPLEDYSLIGISPVADGFRVTLINRNDPTERIVVDSTRPNPKDDIKILDINRKPGRPLSTTVKLSMGRSTGTVGFEEAMLTLTPPPAAAPPQQNPQTGAAPVNGLPDQAEGNRRQPRPRVVPPPANAQSRGGNPQQPGAAQRGRGPSTQGGRERTDRRTRR